MRGKRLWMCMLVVFGGLLSQGIVAAQDIEFKVVAGKRQLFLDDLGIAALDNLARTMHQPVKKGAVIRNTDPRKVIQTVTTPVWDPDEKLYKFWVIGTDRRYRTSRDGLHWTAGPNPNLTFDMATRDPHDPDPNRRYKAVRGNSGFSVSPDGVHWKQLDVPKIQSSDEWNFSYNPREPLFIHTVKRGGPYGRSVAVATSHDFEHWTDYGVVFHADAKDQELGREAIKARLADPSMRQTEYDTPQHYSVQIYNMGIFLYEGIFIGLPLMYHHTGKVAPGWVGFEKLRLSPYIQECVDKYGDYTGFYTVQMISSRDLKSWKRLGDRKPFLKTSPLGTGAYDTQTMRGPSSPLERGEELWFYYTGGRRYAFISSGEDPAYEDYEPDRGAICLAVLRRDGFISLDAKDAEGTILTPAFAVPSETLLVNVTARGGTLRVEALDGNGKVVARSVPVTGDQRRGAIQWEEGKLLALQGQMVSLRFTLRNGSFYSYWFE